MGQFVTGLFAGELADRLDRRRLMIGCDLSRCALYALIPLAWALAGPQIALVYGVVVLTAILDMIFQVAYVTIIPNLVDHSQSTAANARLSTTMALGYVIGPVLAGTIGVPPVLALLGLGGRAGAALGLLTPVRLRRPEELKPAA